MNLFFRKKTSTSSPGDSPSSSLWSTWRSRYNDRLKTTAAGLSRAEQKLSPHQRKSLFAACMALMVMYSVSLAWGLFPSETRSTQHVFLPALRTPSLPSFTDSLPIQARPPERSLSPLPSPPLAP